MLAAEFLTLLAFVRVHGADEKPPTVETKLGSIVGTRVQVNGIEVHQFLGVPFAKPPTSERRFKKPEPVEPWIKPLLAKAQPPACIQYTANPFPWYDDQPGKSEDCLFLNIWVPASANKRAVMYWVFGGGFFVGSIRQPTYQGETLAALGDVIVVTVSYRLGSLGFLYSESEDAPGNVGLWDILAGLVWVNDHIEAFGGDVSRITLAGVSAGSIAVGLLSVSPLTRGLYSRMIMQSGSPAYTLADDNTQSLLRSQKIAVLVGCANDSGVTLKNSPEEVVECLRTVRAEDLIAAESSLVPHSSRSFLPRHGDDILPHNPRLVIIDGKLQKSDLLIGSSQDEGSFQITTSNPDIFGFFGEKEPAINKSTAATMLYRMFSSKVDQEEVVSHFLPSIMDEEDTVLARQQLYTASGDFSLFCPSIFFAEKMAEAQSKVYFYVWDHRPKNTPWAKWMGTPHLSEVPFLFGMPIKNPAEYEEDEVRLSKDMIQSWSQFIKAGTPLEKWPLYSKKEQKYVSYGTNKEWDKTGPHIENCNFFRPFFGF